MGFSGYNFGKVGELALELHSLINRKPPISRATISRLLGTATADVRDEDSRLFERGAWDLIREARLGQAGTCA